MLEITYKRHNGAKMKKVFRKIISKVKIIFNLLKACGWPALLANFLKILPAQSQKMTHFPGVKNILSTDGIYGFDIGCKSRVPFQDQGKFFL